MSLWQLLIRLNPANKEIKAINNIGLFREYALVKQCYKDFEGL